MSVKSDVLEWASGTFSSAEAIAALPHGEDQIRQALYQLKKEGQLESAGRGLYSVVEGAAVEEKKPARKQDSLETLIMKRHDKAFKRKEALTAKVEGLIAKAEALGEQVAVAEAEYQTALALMAALGKGD